jgi:assimilatory nitrate reductase catalytic subunit
MATTKAGVGEAAAASWFAFGVALHQPSAAGGAFTATPIDAGWQLELSSREPRDWEALASSLIANTHADPELSTPYILSQCDAVAGTHAFAAFVEGDRLIGALLVQSAPIVEGRDWLAARLGTALGPSERFRLMAGRPSGVLSSRGPTVCFCCDVGRNEIVDAVHAGCSTLAMVGERTRAGTNCKICRPNVSRLIDGALSAGAG